MRLEALSDGQLAAVIVVIAAIETEILRVVLVRDRAGDLNQRQRRLRSFVSRRLAPSCATPIGTPTASTRSERFASFWLCQ
jgi:hypothetical protein